MRVALYVRVSTEKQELDNQLVVLREWAAKNGHEIVREFAYVMHGHQAKEALATIMDAAKARDFDVLAVWSIDRLSREGLPAVLSYMIYLNTCGVKVYSYQQPYLDPASPFYHTMLAMIADLAKLEREIIVERTRAGLARAKAEGKHMGRPAGSKDKTQRRRSGYIARYEKERAKKPRVNKSTKQVV